MIAPFPACITIASNMSALLEQPKINFSPGTPPTETKICSGCGDEFELEAFRPIKRVEGVIVGRASDCGTCHNKTMRRLRAKKKRKAVRSFISFASREESLERMQTLVNAMFRQFRGVAGFSKVWAEEIERAKQLPESPRLMRSLVALANMLAMVEQNRPSAPSLGQMSDDELGMRIVASLMQEQPEMVVGIGAALGWSLAPPSPEAESQDSIDPLADVAHS